MFVHDPINLEAFRQLEYLMSPEHAAETWTEDVPVALAATAAGIVGHTHADPGVDPETIEDDWDEFDADPIGVGI